MFAHTPGWNWGVHGSDLPVYVPNHVSAGTTYSFEVQLFPSITFWFGLMAACFQMEVENKPSSRGPFQVQCTPENLWQNLTSQEQQIGRTMVALIAKVEPGLTESRIKERIANILAFRGTPTIIPRNGGITFSLDDR